MPTSTSSMCNEGHTRTSPVACSGRLEPGAIISRDAAARQCCWILVLCMKYAAASDPLCSCQDNVHRTSAYFKSQTDSYEYFTYAEQVGHPLLKPASWRSCRGSSLHTSTTVQHASSADTVRDTGQQDGTWKNLQDLFEPLSEIDDSTAISELEP